MRDTSTKYPSTYIQDQQDVTVWLTDSETIEDSDQVDELVASFEEGEQL